jgi:hypothetical protein
MHHKLSLNKLVKVWIEKPTETSVDKQPKHPTGGIGELEETLNRKGLCQQKGLGWA